MYWFSQRYMPTAGMELSRHTVTHCGELIVEDKKGSSFRFITFTACGAECYCVSGYYIYNIPS